MGNINNAYRTPNLGNVGVQVGYKKVVLTNAIALVSPNAAPGTGIIDEINLGQSTMAMVQVEGATLTDENLAVRYRQDATDVTITDGFLLGNYDQIFLSNTVEMKNVTFISNDALATITLHIQFFKQ